MEMDGDWYGFIGLAPLFYKGLNYPKGAFDGNLIPFVIESESYSRLTGIRLMPMLNISIRPEMSPTIKNVGIELSTPVRIARLEPESGPGHSFYLAPGGFFLAKTKDYDFHIWAGFYLEPNYKLVIAEEMVVGLGFQYGRSYYGEMDSGGKWKPHMAIRLYFGRYSY